jgi:drug/metabolite transporter (DMT)-like permease
MNWFIVAIIAQFILGTAVVFDKLIYKAYYKNVKAYTFWLGILGIFALAFVPFGASFNISLSLAAYSIIAGMIFIGAMYFFFSAIFKGETSNEAVLISALSSVFTLFVSYWFIGSSLDTIRVAVIVLLVIGGIILFFTEFKRIRQQAYAFAAISAILFSFSYTLNKYVFLQTSFSTGFMWIKIGGVLAVLLMIVPQAWRRQIFQSMPNRTKSVTAYVANRAYAGLGSVLVYYATFLGPVALINASETFRFVFIFLGGWLLLKERFKGWILFGKISALTIICIGIFILGTFQYYASNLPDAQRKIDWGLTFSQKYASSIGLDWKENYNMIINELKPKYIRLIAYWDLIGASPEKLDFDGLDYQIKLASDNNIQTILVVGQKVPRWPECHIPEWAGKLSVQDQEIQFKDYMRVVINRYKNLKNLRYLQIENEPFLAFGECATLNPDTISQEVVEARSIISNIPILLTDGGEFGTWKQAAARGDVLGTTMYRRVHSNTWGYFDYHLPPEYFRAKEALTKLLTGKGSQRFIVIELGAEPWTIKYPIYTPWEEQMKYFDLDFFKNTIDYAKLSGFDEYYLWGVEWWYWAKTTQNHPEFWNYAKEILSQ